MKHLRYLRYVLLHKVYVFAAGVAIRRVMFEDYRAHSRWPAWTGWIPWGWRLLVHDVSKLRWSEWEPYATFFYADDAPQWIERQAKQFGEYHEQASRAVEIAQARWGEEKKRRMARFQFAWLLHQHRNPHHWQYWLLREDSGKTLVLTPPSEVADEMLADWIGAGAKILALPTLTECIAATVAWYMKNREIMQLRELPRARIERTLHTLAAHYGLVDLAYQVRAAERARASIKVAR